jgi:hypothetical protein
MDADPEEIGLSSAGELRKDMPFPQCPFRSELRAVPRGIATVIRVHRIDPPDGPTTQ